MLEVGGVVHTRSEHHDRRIAHTGGRGRPQNLQQPRRVVGNRAHPVRGEELGEHVRHCPPVLHHIGDPRGRAHVVFEHTQPALTVTNEIDAGYVYPYVTRGLHSRDCSVEVLRRHDEAAGHDPVAHDLSGPVHVGQEPLQREHALTDAAFDDRPFGGGQNSGYEVEWEWSLLLSREREGHAPVGKHAIPHAAPLFEVGTGQRLDLLEEGPVVGAGPIAGLEHLVETGIDAVAVEQITHDRIVSASRYEPMSYGRQLAARSRGVKRGSRPGRARGSRRRSRRRGRGRHPTRGSPRRARRSTTTGRRLPPRLPRPAHRSR